ncbi:MAG: collagen-like protein [Parachlamydiaceae bacterium]
MNPLWHFFRAKKAYFIFGCLNFALPLLGGDLNVMRKDQLELKKMESIDRSSIHHCWDGCRKKEKKKHCPKECKGATGPIGATGPAGENGVTGPTGAPGASLSASSSRYSQNTGALGAFVNLPIDLSFVDDDSITYTPQTDTLTIEITGRYHITAGYSGSMGQTPVVQVVVDRDTTPFFYNVTIGNSYNVLANGVFSFPLSTQSFDLDLLAGDVLYINNTLNETLYLLLDNSGKSTLLELHRISDISTGG